MTFVNRSTVKNYVDAFNRYDRDPHHQERLIGNNKVLDWMNENVPLIAIPDKTIEQTYYFRWWTYRKHIRSTPEGYILTEFLKDVPWAGKYNTISCAAGHHIYEGRWLHNSIYLDQYLQFWLSTGSSIRNYSFWIADAAYNRYLINGDKNFLVRLYPALKENYRLWEEERQDSSGLFWQIDDREGMEFSMGGTGLRPSINSYLYADAKALSKIAELAGDHENAKRYFHKAQSIKNLMQKILWDKKDGFFKTFITEQSKKIQSEKYSEDDNAYFCSSVGLHPTMELFGYTPWYFELPDKSFGQAWRYLMDPAVFNGTYGLATAPIGNPNFMRYHHHECAWDGPSWPFATYQALGGLAKYLQSCEGKDKFITKSDFVEQLHKYAAAHTDETVPWIDENYSPITGKWLARDRLVEWNDPNQDRGMYYNHSAFCDLVLSGLLGVVPKENQLYFCPLIPDEWNCFCIENISWHGKRLDILFDRTGKYYGEGKGIIIYKDNVCHKQKLVVSAGD